MPLCKHNYSQHVLIQSFSFIHFLKILSNVDFIFYCLSIKQFYFSRIFSHLKIRKGGLKIGKEEAPPPHFIVFNKARFLVGYSDGIRYGFSCAISPSFLRKLVG